MEEFSCKTKIISGAGSVKWLKTLGARRLLVVSDPYFAENGTARKIADLSGAEKTEIFSKIKPDPTVELVAEGAVLLKEFHPDAVVALGGGSAMSAELGKLQREGVLETTRSHFRLL